MQLRDYQAEAVAAARKAFTKHKNVLIVAPTASGKSVIIAEVCRHAVEKGSRVLSLCMQGEILEQNEAALNRIAPDVSTGVYCAGRNRKDTDADVVFASRDSLARKPEACGKFDLIVVDEAHLIDPRPGTQYQKIFQAIDCKYILGLTGTPWRLTGGNIWGKGGFFDELSYNISLNLLVDRGYLSPYRFADTNKIIDTEGLRSARGDFVQKELEGVSATEEVVNACLDDWETQKEDRRVSIFFCCSIAHAKLTVDLLEQRGFKVGYLDGATKKAEREELFKKARKGVYQVLVNVGVLTTGVDIPVIDCVVMLRATQSASLFIQSIGRGLRLYPEKEDLLILDYTDNLERFGDDLARPNVKGTKFKEPEESESLNEDGIIPPDMLKACPSCKVECHIAKKVCDYCGYIFISHTKTPFGNIPKNGISIVKNYRYYASTTQKGENCYIAEFELGGRRSFKTWLLHERDNYIGQRSRHFLSQLKKEYVTMIKISNVEKDFPRLDRIYTTKDREPEKEMVLALEF